MPDAPTLPPDWIEAAWSAGDALGLGRAFGTMRAEDWERIRTRVAEIMGGRGAGFPAGWEAALARQAGRPDPDGSARDEADAVLAERGEVFGVEDDA